MKKKLTEYLKDPNVPVTLTSLGVLACFLAGTCVLIGLGFADEWYTYAVYFGAAVSLGYFIYALIRVVPKVKRNLTNKVRSNRYAGVFMDDYGVRTVCFGALSFAINVGMAIYQGVLAILAADVWLGVLSLYYIILSVMRSVAVSISLKKARPKKGKPVTERTELRAYLACGILFLALAATMPFAIAQLVSSSEGALYSGLLIYTAAVFAFYKIVMAAIHLSKAKKYNSLPVKTIRYIGFVGALVSLLTLQTALLSTFGDDVVFAGRMNGISGAVVCILTAAIGVLVLLETRRRKKTLAAAGAAEREPKENDGEKPEEEEVSEKK